MALQKSILVVEDDATIAQAVRARLQAEGYAVRTVSDGEAAVSAYVQDEPDLIVLDRMLPGIDGLEVCRRVQAHGARRAGPPVLVLMLTALGEENDMLVGLGVGADEYMAKPFSMRELSARIAALLRTAERAARTPQRETVRVGEVEIDHGERRVYVAGAEVHLTRTEYDLLSRLAERPGQVYERERLLADIWGFSEATATRTVDSHIRALRRKIGTDMVRTVHGVGYALSKS